MNLDSNLRSRLEKILGYIVKSNVDEDYLLETIEDLVSEYENLQEKYNDLEQEIEENYRPIPVAEQYGISEKDFI